MIRRRSTPWIHRWSRLIIAAIASVGALVTGYLTYLKFTGQAAVCAAGAAQSSGCNAVLSSRWATVFGQPLALFGFLAYGGMVALAIAPFLLGSGEKSEKGEKNSQRRTIENLTWFGLLVGSLAMTVFSSYLMYVLATSIKEICPYCIASALFSLSMLILTLLGRVWEDIGQVLFTGLIVGMVTIVGTLGVYAGNPNRTEISFDARAAGNPNPEFGWEITTTSGPAEIELARHLATVKAKEYVAFWCPHCHEQKLLFGKEAYGELEKTGVKTECAPESPKGKPEDCKSAGIKGFPTWVINGKQYGGVQNPEELAKASGYKGDSNFKYIKTKS